MNFYNKLQPHHHVAIWAISGFLVILSAILYSNSAVGIILGEQNTQPSQNTKDFFGVDGKDSGQNFTMPKECEPDTTKGQALQKEQQALYDQMATLQVIDTSTMTPAEFETHQKKLTDLQKLITAKQAEMDKLYASYSSGPTDTCKKAMVAQSLTMMETMLPKINSKFLGTLSKVDSAVAKVENIIPTLQESDVKKADIDKIKTHISVIKNQVSILRSFFNKMNEFMISYINTAKSNPLKAYGLMQKDNFGDGDSSKAAKAADTMVENFESLIKIMDQIIASQEKAGQ